MEYKIIILSVACFSLLTPPALASVIARNPDCNEAQENSSQAAGLALQGAAALMAVKGAAALALKAAIFKGALIAKGIAAAFGIGAALLSQKPVPPAPPCNPCSTTIVQKPQVPSILDIISGAVENKVEIVSEVVDAVHGKERFIVNEPVLYEYVGAPKYYSVPIIEEYEIDTFK